MKNWLTNKYFNTLLYVTPLLLNAILILLINNALANGFINVGDGALYFTKIEAYKKFFMLWVEDNLGYIYSLSVGINFFSHLYSLLLIKLNLSIKWMELVIYFVAYTGIFYSSWHAFYLIQKRVFNQNNVFFPFLTAFFYSFNIFSISFIGIIGIFFLYQVLFPYLLYILITLLSKEISLKYILIISLIMGLTMSGTPFSFAVYLCLFLPFIFLKKNIFNIKNILSLILSFIISFSLGGPLIYAIIHIYITPNPYAGHEYIPISLIFPPYGIMGIFQFFFHWIITYLDTYSNLYFRNGYGLFSSYMIWALILTTLVIYWKNIKNKISFLFLIISLIFGIFLCKGNFKPLGELNMLMYDLNPFFAIFRTPGSKFGIPIMLILSALILFILNINKKGIFLMLIIMTIFLQTWVFFNPINFTGEKTPWWNKPVVVVSQDYKNLISYVNETKKSGTVLFYPALSGGHYDLKNGVKFSFQDVLGKYIKRPIIYPESGIQFALAKIYIYKIINNFDPKLVGNASVRYVIIRQDYDISRLNEKAEVNRAIKNLKDKNYTVVFTNKLFTVFEINNNFFRDLITIRTSNQEYTPVFQRIAPYHYVVKTKIRDILDNQIVFRNNYHPDWKILDLEKKGLKAKQLLVDDFANGWNIEALDKKNALDPNQDIVLDIYFYPQKILFLLSIVSLVSLSVVLIICAFLLLKKHKKE